MNRSNQAPLGPAFGTLLIRRQANERPSDLELRLRPLAQKIRIVERLAGNAHLMVPGSPSLAVRIYTNEDMAKLEENTNDSGDDVDGLQQFRDSFEHSMVFFVLARGDEQSQLGRRESFVNTAQHALLKTGGGDDNKKKRTTRTLIVPDIAQVINAILSVVQSLSSEKREKKKRYFAQIANVNYLPDKETGKDPSQEAIAKHVSKTFHAWAKQMGMPDGDSNVLLSIMGSLGDVATADAKALDDLPIRNATKEIVSMFFGSSKTKAESDTNGPNNDKFDTGSISEAFDDIDDEELLQIPNPDVVIQHTEPACHATHQWSHANEIAFQEDLYNRGSNFHQNYNPANTFDEQSNAISNHIDFTPIQPAYQVVHPYQSREYHSERASIIPDSFAQQNNFTPHPMQHGYGRTPTHSNTASSYQFAHRSNSHRDYGYERSNVFQQFM